MSLALALPAHDLQREVFEQIVRYDMSREKQYCVNKLGYSVEHVEQMELEYKKFMYLLAAYRHLSIPISEKVDDLWHAHVLHTRRYQEFGEAVFGGPIHHSPTVSNDENHALHPDYMKNTLPLLEKHFGPPKAEFWLDISAEGACCTH